MDRAQAEEKGCEARPVAKRQQHVDTQSGHSRKVALAFRRPAIETGSSQHSVDAYDPGRRQLNASAVLESMERRYRDPQAVVIAITHDDMYIPGFSWRYAFSYRAHDRLAVVSTARMERGCLGLLVATEQRRMSRLRKMVGKNIGVLYYGLPLSTDRRSLLYASIGGPQELDVMSEVF